MTQKIKVFQNKYGFTLFIELHGQDSQALHKSSDCFEYLKKSLLKSSHPKNTWENLLPQKIPDLEISNPPKPFPVIPVAWDLEFPPGYLE